MLQFTNERELKNEEKKGRNKNNQLPIAELNFYCLNELRFGCTNLSTINEII